ncbi:MAG: HAMP domain-containing histidine kinase [Chloracidobacterium sp.]|nr:HAMP domain-containing histidine kinase [Chloracidobacterium sp.]
MGILPRLLIIVFATALPFVLLETFRNRSDLLVLGMATLIAVASGVLAAEVVARSIRRRVQALDRATERISEGDFMARVPESPGHGSDEIGSLERRFNLMAERLVERRRRFSELDTLKSDFVSSVSHELRTPLTTIKALTRLLLRGDLVEEKRLEYLETISVECDRQIDLVLNLLDLSRIEGGVFRLSKEEVDISEVVQSCAKAERRAAERRRHQLEIKPFGAVPSVCADPKALRRVLSNLIENAIKYTPDGGVISLYARVDDGFVLIEVTDNGRGIPLEDLPVLFDKFHRGRPAKHSAAMSEATEYAEFLEDADVSGVGLGLYLGKNVVERMGGDISVETQVGHGSTFTIRLPLWGTDRGKMALDSEGENGKETTGGRR